MSATMALLIGVLFACGTYLVLRRDLLRVVWGLVLFGQAANLTVLTVGGIGPARAPILDGVAGVARMDPLVQALILTAVVIGLGTTVFALLLLYRVYEENQSLVADEVSGWADLYGVEEQQDEPPDGPGTASGQDDEGGTVEQDGDDGPGPADPDGEVAG